MATDEELREQAIKAIKRKRDFKAHLVAYVIVNAFLVLIWYVTGAGYFWPGWVIFGWGIGLAAQGYGVFSGQRPPAEADVQREMDKIRGHSS